MNLGAKHIVTKLETQLPDALYAQVKQLAERENLSLEQVITTALTAQVSAWMTKDYLETRAGRGSWEKAREVLAQSPDVDPPAHDAF